MKSCCIAVCSQKIKEKEMLIITYIAQKFAAIFLQCCSIIATLLEHCNAAGMIGEIGTSSTNDINISLLLIDGSCLQCAFKQVIVFMKHIISFLASLFSQLKVMSKDILTVDLMLLISFYLV